MKSGNLTVYAGPMMAGKTSVLLAELSICAEEGKQIMVVKPTIDRRYSDDDIVTHDGVSLKRSSSGITVRLLEETDEIALSELLDVDVLLVDEAQFLPNLCAVSIPRILEAGIDVVAVGLDMDSEGRGFSEMPRLLAMANQAFKLSAFCAVCGEEANRTFRKLTAISTEQVLIGGSETYEPRCLHHWAQGQREKKEWLGK